MGVCWWLSRIRPTECRDGRIPRNPGTLLLDWKRLLLEILERDGQPESAVQGLDGPVACVPPVAQYSLVFLLPTDVQ